MAYSGNTCFYARPGTVMNVAGATAAQVQAGYAGVQFQADCGIGMVEHTTYTAMDEQLISGGAVRVDYEGEDEALTPGTVQTATTCGAIYMLNGAGATVIHIHEDDANGTLLVGPITLEANKERIIVFPTKLTAATGIFVQEVSGGLAGTPGVLIP
jgi:hypothetical protein